MGTRWTCHGPSLLVLFCYGQLLPWLRTEGYQSSGKLYHETVAKEFLQFYEHTAQVVWNQFMEATWNYVTNITKKNRNEMLHKDTEKSQHMLYFGTRARLFKNASFQDPSIKRMLSKLQNIDKAALPKDELREYNKILAYMEKTYSTAQVCLNEGPCMPLEPDLEEVMATSRDNSAPKEATFAAFPSPSHSGQRGPIRHCGSEWQRHSQPRTPSLSPGLQQKSH
uniref:Uncharacterized protein n=1 Tax=Rousettus aegyptiacus TaxID=9407 RepID=A0A7J8G328_ROUAE|nr:hypothetical protein HJG63_000150 [Rousettus aegyptiacus]